MFLIMYPSYDVVSPNFFFSFASDEFSIFDVEQFPNTKSFKYRMPLK